MSFVVLAPAVGHPRQLLPPLVQSLWILGVQLRGPFGVHILQISFSAHHEQTIDRLRWFGWISESTHMSVTCVTFDQHLTLMKHILSLSIALGAMLSSTLCEAQTFNPSKRVMIEDHTIGQAWSGWWSPRGIVYLEDFMLNSENTGYEVACIHGNAGANQFGFNNFDAMYLPEYSDAALNTTLVGGWPHFLVDRKDGASYDTETSLSSKFDLVSEDFGYANLNVETVFDPSSRNLSVAVGAHFAVDAENFRLAVVLTEDSVHQPGVNGYGQTNAYNFYNGDASDVPMASTSVVFNAHGPVVGSEFMHFRHVARAILPSYDGDPQSLPPSVQADGEYEYVFPNHFISEDYDESKMRVIALLIDGESGEIVNCLGADFNDMQASSVGAPVLAATSAQLFPNPTETSATLQFDCPSAQLGELQVVDALGRVVETQRTTLLQGQNMVDVDASTLENGTYMIKILIDGSVLITEKLLVRGH